ncbi:MAG: hypothetical protein FJ144_07075 [Deltaproteobacteria bacterium]|nr:hypothetical protein [Deltaproteobacteria bacterium]
MTTRQQILYLWLAEGDLATAVVGWAFHDGAAGRGPALPDGEPPYATGTAALEAGWFLLQSPPPVAVQRGREYETGHLTNEFVFERRVDCGA